MTDGPLYIGATVTGGAWFAVAFDRQGFDHGRVFSEVGELWLTYEEDAERILLDVPIGLPEAEDARRCDDLARTVLGARAEEVVAPPVREASKRRRFPAAKRVHERKTDGSLTERAFARSGPIAAVDELLQELPEARSVVSESHPAVCFRAFAGEPLAHSKAIAGGYAERMRALADFDRDAPPAVQSAAEAAGDHDVTVPDVLDAVAMAYTARPGTGELRSLPADPPTGPTGLPMRIRYRAAEPLEPEPL